MSKKAGPRLRLESMSLLAEFWIRKTTNVYGNDCVVPKMANLKKLMVRLLIIILKEEIIS
jgi:hypothetical protein